MTLCYDNRYNSDEAVNILESVKARFPLLTFIVWETRAFNEFANHQMARNFIFIEVEKPLGESVFNTLHEQNNCTTLYKPSVKEIVLYSGRSDYQREKQRLDA